MRCQSFALLYLILRLIDGAAQYFMSSAPATSWACTLRPICAGMPSPTCSGSEPHLLLPTPKWGRSWAGITNDLFDVTEFAHHCPEEFFIAGHQDRGLVHHPDAQASIPLTLVMFACVPVMVVVSITLQPDMLRAAFRRQRFADRRAERSALRTACWAQRVVKAFCRRRGGERKV